MPFDEGHRYEMMPLDLANIVYGAKIRMSKLRRCSALTLKSGEPVWVGGLNLRKLQGDLPVECRVPCQQHQSHRALAKLSDESVTTKLWVFCQEPGGGRVNRHGLTEDFKKTI
jgi:hypothetical protein